MNGFLAHTGEERIDLSKILPPSENILSEYRSVGGGGGLALWGHACGDIHLAQEGEDALLVIAGHIAEIKGSPNFQSQVEACRFLLTAIRQCQSHVALGGWLPRIQGSFGLFYQDLKCDVTLCVSDRMSSRPLWSAWSAAGWIVSSHATAVAFAGTAARLSPAGVGAFLLYGGPIDPSRSSFDNVTALPPGTIMRLFPDGRRDMKRWYTFQHRPDRRMRMGEWLDAASDRLISASSRVLKYCSRPAVFFSGGTDSRLAAAALKAAGGSPLLLTLSDGPNLETRVANMAAKALGLEHRVITRDKHWYLRTLRRAVYETGGVYVWTHGHFATAAEKAMADYGVDVCVLGDLCEAFSKLFCDADKAPASLWTTPEFVRAFDSIRLPLYRPASREATLSLLNRRIRDDVARALDEQMARRFEQLRTLAEDPLIVGDLAFRWETVSLLPTFFMFLDLRSAVAERNIMFDPEVHELLERLPAGMRNGRNLGALLIKRLAPRAAWVVNSNSLVPMFWPPALHKGAKRVKPWLGKARRAVFGKSHRNTGSWQEHAHLYLTDRQWRGSMETIFHAADHFDGELFDRDSVRNSWRAFAGGDLKHAGDVEKLLQLGILNEMLWNGNSSATNQRAKAVSVPTSLGHASPTGTTDLDPLPCSLQ